MIIKNFNLLKSRSSNLFLAFIVCSLLLLSCQPAEQQETEATTANQTTAISADTVERRPAPDFYIIPPGMERKRVWVCDDTISDVFHVDNKCEVLLTCKGTYKNVSLQRAIEDYDRYNCEVCSKELADIFDEEKIR